MGPSPNPPYRPTIKKHYVYLARAADGAYYCGYALDPHVRVERHNAGAGAKSLRGRLPVTLAYARRFASLGDALKFEIFLKKQTHAFKQSLAKRWRSGGACSVPSDAPKCSVPSEARRRGK